MDPKSRRSSSRIATKKSLATVGVESLSTTTANQDPSVAPNPEPTPSPPPQVQRGTKRKAVVASSPTGSHDKKLKRTIVDTTQSKDAVVDVSEPVASPAKSEPVASPAKNEPDVEPGSSTERPITPSCQEDPEKPWVPPVIERRNPLVNRFEVCAFLSNDQYFSN